MVQILDPNTVPLKWHPVQLLHSEDMFLQDATYCRNADPVDIVEYISICNYALLQLIKSDCIIFLHHFNDGKLLLLSEEPFPSTLRRSSNHSVENATTRCHWLGSFSHTVLSNCTQYCNITMVFLYIYFTALPTLYSNTVI